MRLFKRSIISRLDSLGGKDTFVKKNDSVRLIFKVLNFIPNFNTPFFIMRFFIGVNQLYLFNSFRLDLVNAVKLTKQRWVDTVIAEMAME